MTEEERYFPWRTTEPVSGTIALSEHHAIVNNLTARITALEAALREIEAGYDAQRMRTIARRVLRTER